MVMVPNTATAQLAGTEAGEVRATVGKAETMLVRVAAAAGGG